MTELAAKAGAIFNVFRAPGRYGHFGAAAAHFGVSRSALYDWCAQFTEVFARGPGRPPKSAQEVQLEARQAQVEELTAALGGEKAERERLERLLAGGADRLEFTLICLGLPAREIADVLARVFNVSTSHTGVLQRAREYAARGAAVMRQFFWPVAADVDLDEVYIEGQPVMVAVDPRSLAICKTVKDQAATIPGWARFAAELPQLRRSTSDRGQAILGAVANLPDHVHQSDLFHVKWALGLELRQLEASAYHAIAQEERAQQAVTRKRRQGRDSRGAAQTLRAVAKTTAEAIDLFDNLEEGVKLAFRALQLTTAEGTLNTAAQARALLDFTEGWFALLIPSRWTKARNGLKDPALLTYLDEFQAAVAELEVVTAQPADRQYILVTLTRLWEEQAKRRWRGQPVKIPPEVEAELDRRCLNLAAVKDQLFAILDGLHRASSAVESVNSRIGFYRYAKRRFSADFVDLIAIWHNLTQFKEGKRKGHCPADILGVHLPTFDPYELLASG